MNIGIVHKPVIPPSCDYAEIRAAKKAFHDLENRWTQKDLDRLIALRAIGLSYRDCAEVLPRTDIACNAAVERHKLGKAIAHKRAILINKAIR